MAIDRERERILSITAAAAKLPGVKRASAAPKTVKSWMTVGLVAPHGRRVFLEGLRVGAVLCTSEEALDRFFAALSGAEGGASEPTVGPAAIANPILARDVISGAAKRSTDAAAKRRPKASRTAERAAAKLEALGA